MSSLIPRYVTLRTGALMPTLGLGTFITGALPEQYQASVDYALWAGYRHIDTARSYGTEPAVGEVVEAAVREGRLKRRDLFITTKVPAVYMAPADARRSVEESLHHLRTSYADMLLIHHPWGRRNRGDGVFKPFNDKGEPELANHDFVETWRAFEEVLGENKARAIGVSNFTVKQIERIRQRSKITPANVQLEFHVYNQQPELLSYCRKHGIVVSGYAPLGAPGLTTDSPTESIPQSPVLLEDKIVLKIAENRQVKASHVLLNYALRQKVVVLAKSVNTQRIRDNMDIYDIGLTDSDIQQLRGLHTGFRYHTFSYSKDHPEFFQNEAF